MKILLLQNVKKVGQKGQIVEVSEGYGRNFLINRGLAKIATKEILKTINNKKNQEIQKTKTEKEKKIKNFLNINKKTFSIKSKANEKGILFASIHKKQIAELTNLDEEDILLNNDLKEIGEFEIKIKAADKKGKIILKIEAL